MEQDSVKKRIQAEDYNFNVFELKTSRYDVFISVAKSNRFGLSQSMVDKYRLADFKTVDLLYDRQKKAVGFIFRKDEEGKLKLNILDQGAYVNAKAFFGLNEIDVNRFSGRYDVKKISSPEQQDIFVIELTKKR